MDFVSNFLEFQHIKVDHRHLVGLLQPHDIPMTKWEFISMDFIVGLPLTYPRHNGMMVVVEKLTKIPHFIPIRDTYDVIDVERVFINEIVRLHGVPKKKFR